jgi:hypothetical protein
MSGTLKKPIPEYRVMAKPIKVQQLQGGQLIVSIPGALASALDPPLEKGDEITWKIDFEKKRIYLERAR